MTLDEFQKRLRAIFDTTLTRSAETQAAHQMALQTLFDEAEAAKADPTALGGIVNAEVVRFHELLRELQKAAGG